MPISCHLLLITDHNVLSLLTSSSSNMLSPQLWSTMPMRMNSGIRLLKLQILEETTTKVQVVTVEAVPESKVSLLLEANKPDIDNTYS